MDPNFSHFHFDFSEIIFIELNRDLIHFLVDFPLLWPISNLANNNFCLYEFSFVAIIFSSSNFLGQTLQTLILRRTFLFLYIYIFKLVSC